MTNTSRSVTLGDSVRVAGNLWERSRGLLGCKGLEPGAGLLLEPCSGIHSIGMSFAFDAIFLDKDRAVVHLVHGMPPLRVSRYVFRAHSVLELPAGTIEASGTRVGDRLALEG